MINKLRFYGGELKHSFIFVLVVIVQVAISIFLLNMTLTKTYHSTAETKYYSKKVADKSYVMFNQGDYFGATEAGALSNLLDSDLRDLASTFEIGKSEYEYVDENGIEQVSYSDTIGVATPALLENLHAFGATIKPGNAKGYYEAMIFDYHNKYRVGEIYELNYQTSDEQKIKSIKIKVMSLSEENDYFYNFSAAQSTGQFINSYLPFYIMICDDIKAYDYADLTAGIFINNKPANFYQKFGFESKSVQQLYDEHKARNIENSKYLSYLSAVIILFAFVSTFCMYIIDVYKSDRKRAVNYICGVTPRSQLTIELIKMVTIFVLAFIPNLAVSIILGAESLYNTMGGNMVTVPYAIAATAIMLGVYGLSIAVGMVKYVKTKPVQIINNVH